MNFLKRWLLSSHSVTNVWKACSPISWALVRSLQMLSDGTAPENRLTSSVFLLSDGFAQLFSRRFTMSCMLRSSFSIVDGFKSWWTEFCLAVSHISLRVVHETCAEFRDHVIFLNWWWLHQASWPCLDSKLVNMVHSSPYYMQSTMGTCYKWQTNASPNSYPVMLKAVATGCSQCQCMTSKRMQEFQSHVRVHWGIFQTVVVLLGA